MATKFGSSAVGNNNTKIFWIIGCVVTLFAVLLITFAITSQNSSQSVEAVQNQPIAEPVAPSLNGQDIVVPVGRIEEGTRLEESMFATVGFEPDKVPVGAIRKQDMIQVVGKFSTKILSPNIPLIWDDMSDARTFNPLTIPSGYRAVTINVDIRSGVEGFAKPNSRVDVLWTFTQDGQQKVSTIVRFTKILSVGGMTASDSGKEQTEANKGGATTITLLVSEKDAKKIELARNLGTLSLSLVGDQEEGTKEEDPDVIDINTLLGSDAKNEVIKPSSEPADGYMQTKDPKTGKTIKYAYHKSTKKWTIDRSEEALPGNTE